MEIPIFNEFKNCSKQKTQFKSSKLELMNWKF